MSDFYASKVVTALVEHECEERCTIKPGTKYVRIAGRWEGDFYTAKLCVRCDRLHTKVRSKFDCDVDEYPAFGELLSWIQEARRQ